MKYYLIVGEASGDLHASNLMKSLKSADPSADFRYFGGDLMQAVGGSLVKHYKEMAYMGFIPVITHLGTIVRNMNKCKADIKMWQPDAVILVDYPGFNLKIANYVHSKTSIPVFYYISPKIWAWKEYRIKNIRRDVDRLYSILPFEVDFFKKHSYEIDYVGNPCVDAISSFKKGPYGNESLSAFSARTGIETTKPIIALLPGSRKQEIKDNLPLMIEAAMEFPSYQAVIAGAPSIDKSYYSRYIPEGTSIPILFDETYSLVQQSVSALVTSGTATLETAILGVPQVVCYYTPAGKLISWLRGMVLKVKYISLVNLIGGREVVKELVADGMNSKSLKESLAATLPGGSMRESILEGYSMIHKALGAPGASDRAAEKMIARLQRYS